MHRVLALSCLADGVFLLTMVTFPSLPLALALFVLAGPAIVGFVVGSNTLLQTTVDDRYRGRVFGALGAASGLVQLCAVAAAGVLGGVIGIVLPLQIGACSWLVAGCIGFLLPAQERREATEREIEKGRSGVERVAGEA